MTINQCPGLDKRFWREKDIFEEPCPQCGAKVELWKDDPVRKCPSCGHLVRNPRLDLGCAEWCKFATECPALLAAPPQAGALKTTLIDQMRKTFEGDPKRIGHGLAVLEAAWEILSRVGGDPLVVTAAAILHDIGIPEAERTCGSAAAEHQEKTGPPIARQILEKLGVEADRIDHVCRIIGSHHSGGDIDTREFRIIWDADHLVNASGRCGEKTRDDIAAFIDGAFRTEAGKALARERLLKTEGA